MDQNEYNNQAIDWRVLKEGSVIAMLSYSVPRVDTLHYAAETIKDPDPWYMEDSIYGGPIVPSGFFYAEFLRLLVAANIQFGYLNTQLCYESKGPVFHGEQVTIKGTIDCLYEKRGRHYLDVSFTVQKGDGQIVGKCVATLLREL